MTAGRTVGFAGSGAAPLAITFLASLHASSAPAPTPTPSAPAVAPAPTPTPGAATRTITIPAAVSDGDLDTCLGKFRGIDLPYMRGDDRQASQVIVCRRGYVLGYDVKARDPNWVVEHLTPASFEGSAKRRNRFKQDPLVRGADASNTDYSKSGYDRGHQAPSADAATDQVLNDETFFFTNMAPQVGVGFNQGIWRLLEETVRAWVICGGRKELYVITGPIYDPPKGQIGPNAVVVPAKFYKIVYDPASDRAVGFVLPNVNIGAKLDNPQQYVVAIADIEGQTGINFFRSWSFRRQQLLEARPGLAWGRTGNCSGEERGPS